MTPLQLARQCCANWEPDGGCLGVRFGDDGRIVSCSPQPKCWLAEGKPCRYFEECVLPVDRSLVPAYSMLRDGFRQKKTGGQVAE